MRPVTFNVTSRHLVPAIDGFAVIDLGTSMYRASEKPATALGLDLCLVLPPVT